MSKRVYEHTTAVQIVRPDSGSLDSLGKLADLAITTWLVMLALGALVPVHAAHLGYWQTLLGVYAFRSLIGAGNYVYWSRPRRAVKR